MKFLEVIAQDGSRFINYEAIQSIRQQGNQVLVSFGGGFVAQNYSNTQQAEAGLAEMLEELK